AALAVDLEVAGVDPMAEECRRPGAFGGAPGSRRVGAPDGPARQEEEEDRARKRPPGAPKPHATPHPPRPRRTMSLAGSACARPRARLSMFPQGPQNARMIATGPPPVHNLIFASLPQPGRLA